MLNNIDLIEKYMRARYEGLNHLKTALRFYFETKDKQYLDLARGVGESCARLKRQIHSLQKDNVL